ncbi:TonB-dependent receptor [Catenovulum maritimum]|uniref:TonB-dependent receptor n=1 Tax=Catenovulum maritimum TaxID=1513271 RepID=A0A0J8GST0_9ALTE|nr:TonB-dependent receptor [Catenovulum maritimum]KMT65807.1 TonB-dependent receptor [Catenovulum maritimum]
MHIKKRIAVAVAAMMPMASLAKNIEGTIVNQLGEPISGASIQVEGTDKTVMTNQQGVFSISNLAVGENKLHIIAKGFAHSHQHVDVPETGINQYQVALARSPIEVIDVVASPVHLSVMESTIPVNVIAGETLRQQQADTLGDSLEKLAGVNTNFHANVASTPIIRGLSGPRVLIAQNGLDVGDVSRVGPDHSVATEAATAQQIEVFRGPATLFYGSGAIGGVVNVVDGRIPTDNATRGEWQIQTSSVNQQKQGAFNLTTGTGSVAVYADAFWRDSKDYKVPVDERRIANSAEESKGFTLGTSYLLDNGYFGVSVEKFKREYGIPGHSHGDEAAAEQVYADLDQTRIQFLSEINLSNPVFNQLNLRASNSDYEHAEIEAGSVGTLFKNSTQEFQLELQHNPVFDWKGGLNFHYKNSEISAVGSEAFTPPSTAETFAMAILEEKHIGDVLYQVGARVEQVRISSDQVLLPDLPLHAHAEDESAEDAHEHDHNEHQAGDTRVFDIEHKFTPISFSAGLVWDFMSDYNLGVSLSRSQRAPSASELMSFGPHIGTRSYEVGALFEIHQESDSAEFELNKQPIELETSKNIDFTLRKTQGDLGFVFNLFYNQVDNYYYQSSTGLFAEVTHEHASDSEDSDAHDHDHDHDHASELPVYTAQINDVVLHGFEAQIAWQLTNEFKTSLFSDFVRAKLKDGGDLPRTPPLRLGAQFSYQNEKLSAQLHITRYQKQDKISVFETTTPGYTLMDANLAYDLNWFNLDTSVYLKVSNLTNTEARVHTSFLKDLAPRPGRNVTAGIRGYF